MRPIRPSRPREMRPVGLSVPSSQASAPGLFSVRCLARSLSPLLCTAPLAAVLAIALARCCSLGRLPRSHLAYRHLVCSYSLPFSLPLSVTSMLLDREAMVAISSEPPLPLSLPAFFPCSTTSMQLEKRAVVAVPGEVGLDLRHPPSSHPPLL